MELLQPWLWTTWQMPPDKVEAMTPRQADRFITRGLERQARR